jgi:sirohydrochlorin ferrochelatase
VPRPDSALTSGAALVAVAHGSRDPRSAETVARLIDRVRRARPELDVRLSFLDLSAPRLPEVLDGVHADGHRHAVVVPLLLGHAFHARVDVPGAVARSTSRRPDLHVTVADVLGGHPGLDAAALRRLAAAAGPLDVPGLGVVLAGVGSSDTAANAAVDAAVQAWSRRFGWTGAVAAFATAAPSVADGIAAMRRRGAERVAVAQWVLAPGLLPDRIAAAARAAAAPLAAPLGPADGVVAAVLDRYEAAVAPAVAPTGPAARRAG